MFWRVITLCSRGYKIFFKCWWKKNVFTTLHCNKIICEHKKGSITTSTSSMIKSNKNSISASFDVQSIVMYTFANKCLDLNPINLKMFYVKDESKEAIYLNWQNCYTKTLSILLDFFPVAVFTRLWNQLLLIQMSDKWIINWHRCHELYLFLARFYHLEG